MAKKRLNRISIVLDEFDFSQKDLAYNLGVSENTVSRWCKNYNQPDLLKIRQIATFFRIDNLRLVEPFDWKNEPENAPYLEFLKKKSNGEIDFEKPLSKENSDRTLES